MVLGPLPLGGPTIVLAKLAALSTFLIGVSAAVNTLNSLIFAIETSDQFGFGALVGHFAGCLVVTTAAATLVFATIVTVRATLAMFGSTRATALAGTALQFVFVFALFWFFIALVGSPARIGRFSVPDLGSRETPLSWFVAWFEVIRRSDRGSWDEVIAMSRRVTLLVPLSVIAAVSSSVLAFRRQLRLALTPAARPGPLGHARLSRIVARVLCGPDRRARAVSDFVLITIVRSRVQQAPIAINAAIGFAMVLFALARQRGDATPIVAAAPLLVAYWIAIGLRASFFVPSELPAGWMFLANAPERRASYRAGVRAAMFAFTAPATAGLAWVLRGWQHALLTLLLVGLLVDFVPFTRAYIPGHAKLKSRWPLYVLGAVAFAFGLPHLPLWAIATAIAGLETVGYRLSSRWTLQPKEDEVDTDQTVRLNLTGATIASDGV
jgi:hypothetical protein